MIRKFRTLLVRNARTSVIAPTVLRRGEKYMCPVVALVEVVAGVAGVAGVVDVHTAIRPAAKAPEVGALLHLGRTV